MSMHDVVRKQVQDAGHFTVTEDHLKLLQRAYVEWDDMEFGAPAIDPKRPYGNSDVLRDLADALDPDWATFDEDSYDEHAEAWLEENEERLTRLHAETMIVLQIALATGSFAPGRYVLAKKYDDTSWRPASEPSAPASTTRPEHLVPTQSGRGLAYMPPLSGTHGGAVTAYESSAASEPRVWLKAVEDGREATVQLTAETAWKLSDQLRTLVTNHYQGDATPAWARKD